MSRLDYCNTVLNCRSSSQNARTPPRRVQRRGSSHGRYRIGDVMRPLHWLPIAYRMRFILSVNAIYKVRNQYGLHRGPNNIDIIASWSPNSAVTNQYKTPRIRFKFCDRAYSVAGHENETTCRRMEHWENI